MKRAGILLLVTVMLLTLTACDISTSVLDLLPTAPEETMTQPPVVQPTVTQPETTQPTRAPEATVPTTPTEEVPQLVWDPALYDVILKRAQAEFAGSLSACSYLLYDINQDGIPEMVLNLGISEEVSQYRFYTTVGGEASLLKILDTLPSGLCGYELGKGMIIYGTYQSSEHVSVVTLSNSSLSVELVADHPMGSTHAFAYLPSYDLTDSEGLNWQSNPMDFNDIILSQLRAEEQLYRGNMVDWFTNEQMREINIFLSNFSEQRFRSYPADEYALLHFVYLHCIINRERDIQYIDYDACISRETVNSIFWQFFRSSFTPDENYIRYSANNSFDIVYEDGWVKYPAILDEDYRYLTIVREMIPNGDGTYQVVFDIYKAHADSLDQYYQLRPSDVAKYPELQWITDGTAVVRDYWRSQYVSTYQLIKYFEN